MRSLVLIFLIISVKIYSQSVVLNADVNPGGYIIALPLAPPETTGSLYIDEHWLLGDFDLIDGIKIEKYPLKYNLKNNTLEIDFEGGTRVCHLNQLKKISWKKFGETETHDFVNTTYYAPTSKDNTMRLMNILLEQSHLTLFKHYYLDKKESSYVVEFDIGSKDNKMLLKYAYYIFIDNSFYELKSSLKKNKVLFKDHYLAIEKYSKLNKLKIKNQTDLINLMQYYNSLL